MKFQSVNTFVVALALVLLVPFVPVARAQSAGSQDKASQWKPVEDAMGRPGKLQSDGTFKFGMPRKDLSVMVAGTPIKPGLALGSWTAFEGTREHAMAMGDLEHFQCYCRPYPQ